MVAFGGYVGLTTLFESLGPHAFVVPPGILDTSIGYHIGRGRGPFLEGSVNGVGLYISIVFCALAVATWERRWPRLLAVGVGVICAIGLVLTLTRSVWVGATVATILTLAGIRELRRFLVPVAATCVVGVVVLFAAVPALETHADERRSTQRSVWEREQVNDAALDLAMQRPLVGQGVGTFNERNALHFRLSETTPMVAELHLGIHNQFLQLLTETGLIGVTLFVACLLAAIGGTLLLRGPPGARPWKIALLAASLFWALVANLAPIGQVFPSTVLWLLAGAVAAACASAPRTTGPGPVGMRIAWVSHSAAAGGAELALVEGVRALVDRGQEVDVAVPRAGPLVGLLRDAGAQVLVARYPLWVSAGRWRTPAHRARRVAGTVAGAGALVATARAAPARRDRHEHAGRRVPGADRAMARRAARLVRARVRPRGPRVALRSPARRRAAADAPPVAEVIVDSQAVGRAVRDWADPARVHVVYYAVDVPSRPCRQPGDGVTLRLALVGSPRAGQATGGRHPSGEHARRARRGRLARARRRCGRGLRAAPASARRSGRRGRAACGSRRSRPTGWRRLGDADVALMCSSSEAFGRTTVEAMKLGRPVIGADAGGTAELVRDGWNGLLYPPATPRPSPCASSACTAIARSCATSVRTRRSGHGRRSRRTLRRRPAATRSRGRPRARGGGA